MLPGTLSTDRPLRLLGVDCRVALPATAGVDQQADSVEA